MQQELAADAMKPGVIAAFHHKEWATAVGCSRWSTCELIDKGIITSVKFGGARIVTTHPREFLAYCAEHPDPLQHNAKARIAVLNRIA